METQSMTTREKLANAPGFTRIPHKLADLFYSGQLTRTEAQILMVIARLTLGFDMAKNEIGGSRISALTGISKPNIWRAVDRLEELKIIRVARREFDGRKVKGANSYAINPLYLGEVKYGDR
jgi:phage replication O-like protein O